VFGDAGRRLRPAELPVERSHAPYIPTGERNGADPCWDAHQPTSVSPQSGDILARHVHPTLRFLLTA
jgi:hypothetical protein